VVRSTKKKPKAKKTAKKAKSGGASSSGSASTGDGNWERKKPTKPGEVTVFLKNGNYFTGMLVKEDEKIIALNMSGAEMQWQKRDLREILRYKEPDKSGSGTSVGKIKLPFW